jgi:hypothetical protein
MGKYASNQGVHKSGIARMDGLHKTLTGKMINKQLQTSEWYLKNLSLAQQDYLALDAIVSIMLYDIMEDMPDNSIRLIEDNVNEGVMADIVPKFGSRAVMAQKAAEGKVVSLHQHWLAPVGVHPPTHPFQHQNARTCTHHSRSGAKLPDC